MVKLAYYFLHQLYWTDAAVSTIVGLGANEHRPAESRFRFRYQEGTGPSAFADNINFNTPLFFRNNTPQNAAFDCVEFRWPRINARSQIQVNECFENCPVLCKSACE